MNEQVVVESLLEQARSILLAQQQQSQQQSKHNNNAANNNNTSRSTTEQKEQEQLWSILHRLILCNVNDFNIHRACYDAVYNNNNVGTATTKTETTTTTTSLTYSYPCWIPNNNDINNTNIMKEMKKLGFINYYEFYKWSIIKRNEFWMHSQKTIGIKWSVLPTKAIEYEDPTNPTYFPNGKLNIIDSCLDNHTDINNNKPAILYGNDPNNIQTMTVKELHILTNQISNAIRTKLNNNIKLGSCIAICIPMIPECIAIYYAIIQAGYVVVSIADSFSAHEIAIRCRIANVKAIITQDVIYRGNKALPLYQRIIQADNELLLNTNGHDQNNNDDKETNKTEETDTSYKREPMQIVVVPASLHVGDYNNKKEKDDCKLHETIQLRTNIDWYWYDFLHNTSTEFQSIQVDSMTPCNILFSSGTTGEPKAIVWTHVTPIKCAIDGYYHQNITSQDNITWPTNIGWMMGPWLLYQHIHNCTICLYQGLPHTKEFVEFIQSTKITMLGVIPSLVQTWQTKNIIQTNQLTTITRFSSTGEASDPYNYHWLMSRVKGYAPIIEYCGGTEIGGSFLSSTLLHNNIPSMFSTPVLGSNICLLDSNQNIIPQSKYECSITHNNNNNTYYTGELVIIPPSIGLSTKLLNRCHYECYYKDMPNGLRKHGDEMQIIYNNNNNNNTPYYRALGRCDDTMNIGGIKISSIEIERVVCNNKSRISYIIKETAAIAISSSNNCTTTTTGPSQLVIYVVLLLHNNNDNNNNDALILKKELQIIIKKELNPLFHLYDVVIIQSLPRTVSNKIMRRTLRDMYIQQQQQQNNEEKEEE